MHKITLKYYLLLFAFVGGMLLSSCSHEPEAWAGESEAPESDASTDERPLVAHEVSVALDAAATRVAYTLDGDNLQLSWEANEALGVYIRRADNSVVYAGQLTGFGADGERGERRFTGVVSQKTDAEQYLYIHPTLPGERQGALANGQIFFNHQSGALNSTRHLSRFVPLIWTDGATRVCSHHGYAIHLQLTFTEDPGTITQVTLQTMPEVGETLIFPATFDASTMAAGSVKQREVTLNVTSGAPAKGDDNKWHADAYLACSRSEANVFRTKFDVKVVAQNGTYYNEFRSFPGQESATETLPMLANGHCYNLTTAMSKDVAPTVINSQYKVNSLLGMWNPYGKVTDPFHLSHPAPSPAEVLSGFPAQLKSNILDKQASFTARTLVGKSAQGTPTFTWAMVTKQIVGNSDGYKQADVTYNNIDIVNAPTEVFVTFISEYAWSQNLLGYYHYPTGSVPASSNDVLKTIIFPNVSKGGHVPYNKGGVDGGPNVNPNTEAANVGTADDAPLQEYTTVQLLYNNHDGTYSKEFPAGTTIGFFMMRDPKASSSDHDEGTMGDTSEDAHTGYQPRPDNTLLDWNAWRLFTNTKWNSASGNTGWWNNMSCQNFFCSADVGNADSGGVIPGLALYGAKDDASHNYNYSFSAMLYMVSTGNPSSMQTANKCYFNIGSGGLVIDKP